VPEPAVRKPKRQITPRSVEVQVQTSCIVEPGAAPRPSVQAHPGDVVVLVDDSDTAREAVRGALEAGGYTVLEARNGAAALALCESLNAPPDLLLVDLGMPDVGGSEVVQELARVHALSRVLIMTGHGPDLDDAGQPMLLNCPVIRKPFTAGRLLRRVREILATPSLAPQRNVAVDATGPIEPPPIRMV
jgi:DNA-binding response OmpR family regulator